jgi:hypothetical protein
MATGRINKKVLEHNAHINRETKQMQLSIDLKKEVETGKNGTQKYVLKQGPNKNLHTSYLEINLRKEALGNIKKRSQKERKDKKD